MQDLEIRPLELHDARAVYEITIDPDAAKSLGTTPFDSFHAFEARFRAGGSERLGAFFRGKLVAFSEIVRGVRARLAHAGDLCFAVHPEHRRCGVGTALLRATLEAADRWMNLVRLCVDVLADDAVAHRFLSAHGFSAEVRRKRAMLCDGALADMLTFARIRPGFAQPDGALAPMPAPPARRALQGPIVMRPTLPQDAPRLSTFSRDETILLGSSQIPTMNAEFWRRRIEGWTASWSIVALSGEEIVACGNLHSAPSPRARHSVTLGISVSAAHQGIGIGDRMMRVLLDAASMWLGAERVELMVLADNTRAVRLYEKHGFELEGLRRYDVWRDGGYADSRVMARLFR